MNFVLLPCQRFLRIPDVHPELLHTHGGCVLHLKFRCRCCNIGPEQGWAYAIGNHPMGADAMGLAPIPMLQAMVTAHFADPMHRPGT